MEVTKLVLSHCDHFQFPSQKASYTYDIRVYVPEGEVPTGGYPVFYVLDGCSYFQIARDVVHLQSRNAPRTHVDKAIVIGIGHQESDTTKRRFYDFTAPADDYIYPPRLQDSELGPHGGAVDFLAFIEQELMPYVQQHYPIHSSKQSLYGHSLGGYFSLWVKFTRPELFQTYLAVSPSVWWNNHELIRYAEQFAANMMPSEHNNIMITVGEDEGFMIEDADKLREILQKYHLTVGTYVAPEENHASVVPTTMSRMFRFGCASVKE
ncbi:alpha/beta hydrolase [Paenibacillus sp. FSL K6-2524]|uniref:alpha/beta hydrolase n=1 Tax=Paenibacillus sp. FSL K6-2524 TaxID=2954516 RepID=UPI0030FA84E4